MTIDSFNTQDSLNTPAPIAKKRHAMLCITGAVTCVSLMTTVPTYAMVCLSEGGSDRKCQSAQQINNYYTNSVYQQAQYEQPTTIQTSSIQTETQSNRTVYQPVQINRYPQVNNNQPYQQESRISSIEAFKQKEYGNSNNQLVTLSKAEQNRTGFDRYSEPLQTTTSSSDSYFESPQLREPIAKPFVVNQYATVSSGSDMNYFDLARQAANRGDSGALAEYEQRMAGTLFAMYPEYWRLDSNLSQLSAATVTSFVRRYPNAVMAEKLVADFAEMKAKNGDYRAVQQVANYIQNADKSEACAIGMGDVQSKNSRRLQEQKEKVWLNTKKQPLLCDQFAMTINNSRYISSKERQDRLYRMIRLGKSGQIMALSGQLGAVIGYTELQSIRSDVNSFLTRFSREAYSQKNQYLYLYAISRIADKSYSEAITQLEYDIRRDNQRSQPLLATATRRMAYRTIAVKRMNMNTDDGFSQESLNWFRKSVGETFNFEEAEDYAIAAIRFNQWSDVISAVNNMSNVHKQKAVWQYWLARALQQTGKNREAKRLFTSVAANNTYYGFLAKDKLGQRNSLRTISRLGGTGLPNISSAQRATMLQNPSFARAFALYSVHRNHAKREWNWGVHQAIKNRDKKLLLAAARHAHDLGWYDRSIYAMEKASEEWGMLNAVISHPMPHQSSVTSYAYQAGIDPAWAYGIMRQESRFNVSAKSHVGAGGLMQIMPSTGKYIARNLGERYNARRISSGDTNIRYGTWYMGDILNELGGQPVLATAGYNAGPSKARAWQPYYGSIEADQYVESIAYPETKNYVKRVMENATIYGERLNRGQNISQRMGVIYPK